MRLDAFLADLLYRHDCVVVPGFGGLVANYRPSRLDRHSHFITPPAKHIGFNRNLQANDGLLSHHIASVLGITYAQALDRIREEVTGYQRKLATGQRIVWEKIGFLYFDHTGNLQFIPDEQENFLPSSFGLQGIQLKPVQQRNATLIQHPGSQRKPLKMAVAAAIALPLLAAGVFLFTRQGTGHQLSLNPFRRAVTAEYSLRPGVVLPDTPAFETGPELEDLLRTKNTLHYSFTEGRESEDGIEVIKHSAPAVSTGTTLNKPDRRGNYTLVAGAFAVPENALRYIDQLSAKGIEAFDAGMQRGLRLVGVGSYATRSEAIAAQRNIQQADGVKVWIRKN